jgi:broad-specificity NMP kinase
MGHLVFVAGPPGIGKTTTVRALFARLPSAAWLDGDDVWRIRPFRVDEGSKRLVEDNIVGVLSGYLAAGYEHVLLSWVLHRQELVERLVSRLGQPLSLHVALVCDPEELVSRRRARGESEHALALERLAQVRTTRAQTLDTQGRSPDEVAEAVAALL